MNELVIHPDTQARLIQLEDALPQSLLLYGEEGVGLLAIAQSIAGKNIAAELHPINAAKEVDNENGTIIVELIRQLYEQTRSKHTTRQVIIIDNADRMSHGAQGAFLKLLEEPNSHTYFILTSHTPEKLLTTIRSRVQQQIIRPITREQTAQYIESIGIIDKTKLAQLLFIAEGLPAEISRLQSDEDYFAKRAVIMGDARQLLQADPYQKLRVVGKYHGDRMTALVLIDSTLLVARRSLTAKPQPGLIKLLDKLLGIRQNIQANHNIRLQLARIVL